MASRIMVAFRNKCSRPWNGKTKIRAFSFISGYAFTIGSLKLYNRSKNKPPMKNQQSFKEQTSNEKFNKSQTNNVNSSYTSLWNNLSVTQKSLTIGTGVVAGIAAVVATPAVLSMIGFASGVTKASLAAYAQSCIGNHMELRNTICESKSVLSESTPIFDLFLES
eukprot:468725_1